jgi:hypothetical protein
LYQSLLQDSRFIDLLLRLDQDIAAEARQAGCSCGGRLHRADYQRKPRGGPAASTECTVRFSFCCARDGCRRRASPGCLRFLGRKVFYAVVVLLVPVLRDGPTPKRLGRLREEVAVSTRTIRRWCRFWRETFVSSRRWAAIRGRLAKPVESTAMPRSLLEVFSGDLEERIVAVLRLVSSDPSHAS